MKVRTLQVLGMMVIGMMMLGHASEAAMEKGDMEIGGYGSFTSSDTSDDVNLSGNLGYFCTDSLQVIGNVMLNFSDDFEMYIFGFGADYHLPISDATYGVIGAAVSILDSDFFSETGLDLHVGLKNFVSERVSVNYMIRNQSYDESGDRTSVEAGISIYF